MRILLLAIAAAALWQPAAAKSLSVVQTNGANVYGLVQVGPQNGPVTVRQTGLANITGVMQVGPRNQVGVTQTGLINRAAIGQFSTQSLPGFIP